MSKGYKEKLDWKEISQDNLQILKHKKVKFSSFLCLCIINITIILTFAILFTNYQQQHPYSLDEVASLTDSLAYEWYNETTEFSIDTAQEYYETTQTTELSTVTTVQDIDEISQEQSTTEDEQVSQETETQEETTSEIVLDVTTVEETTVEETPVEETTVEETTVEETTTIQTTTAVTTTAFAAYSSSLAADTLVYVTSSGSKFHYITCSYLSSSCISLSYSQAISKGYSPCSRCFPNG